MEPSAFGRRACDWIVGHQNDFFAPGEGETAARARAKCLAELALVTGTIADEMPEARTLFARAWQALDEGEQLARLLPTWPVAATSYLPFRIVGCRSQRLEQHLADRSWLSDHAKWPAFVRFAIGVTLQSIGVALPWDETEVVLAIRFFEPPALQMSPARAVFLAHAMMWGTEMGRNRARVGPHAIELYRGVSPAWHRVLGDAGLLDPLGEIVIADACSGTEPCGASLARIVAAQRSDGSLPPRDGDSTREFDDLYHPTCVAALAGILAGRAISGNIRSQDA